MIPDRIHRLHNACIEPYHFVDGKFNGGVEAEKECLFARMAAGRNWRDNPLPRPSDASYLAGRYLYAGPLWNHFGHILVDSIHRLWAWHGQDAVVFNGVVGLRGVKSKDDLKVWNYPLLIDRILAIMGLMRRFSSTVRQPTVFEEIDIPEPGAVYKGNIKPFYRLFLKRYQEAISVCTEGLTAARKLYYPRTHLLNNSGIHFQARHTLSARSQITTLRSASQKIYRLSSSLQIF